MIKKKYFIHLPFLDIVRLGYIDRRRFFVETTVSSISIDV